MYRQHCAAIIQKMCPAQGNSFRTGDRLTRLDNSAIRGHRVNNDQSCKISNFNIIDSTTQVLDLRMLESMHIITNRPRINNNQTATTINYLDIT